MVEDVLEGTGVVIEILKSPRMLRSKKYKQVMAPVHVSPRNPVHNKLSMAKKGKVVMIDIDEEEEDL